MGLQKVLTGSARSNETQLSALLNTLPGVEPDSGSVQQKLGAFTQNLGILAKGLPRGTCVEMQGFGGQQPTQLPKGNGQQIDQATAQSYLQAAGGDPTKARQLAGQNGWKF